jgi:NADP-dependent 3-hydroxy acid dehydrogenase YdfG
MTPSPKTVLITGCSVGGIGSALALEFHRRGLHVFATARSLDKLAHLANLDCVTLLQLDVTSQASQELTPLVSVFPLEYFIPVAALGP